MKAVYEEVKTPRKVGMVLEPEAGEMLDNPTVFRHGSSWYMMFIRFDGKGYETHLAKSDDLLKWKRLGRIFSRGGKGAWDSAQADGWPALVDTRWEGPHTLNTFGGKYWMMYLGGAADGYETDPLSTGVAWTDDPSAVREWTRYEGNPVMRPSDLDARAFERKTIYKHFTVEDPSRSCGGRFVNFYNAKQEDLWRETIGMAVSDDMLRWRRVGDRPVMENGDADKPGISGDPMIRRIGDTWVMFYFGYKWKAGVKGAFDTFACSYDLKHWTKWDGEPLVKPSEDYDSVHAHKPWVLKHDGVVYHWYCAVRRQNGREVRGIALATSAIDEMPGRMKNPLAGPEAPDPFIAWDETTQYYYHLHTEFSRLELYRAKRVRDILVSEHKTVYVTNAADRVFGDIWAPEMHKAPNGKWYIYTSGRHLPKSGAPKRLFVMESKTSDPFDGFVFKGMPTPDTFSIDPTVMTWVDGRQYICYSEVKAGWEQVLVVREMANPWTFGAREAVIARPELAWERVDKRINEGAFFVRSPDGKRLFIVYSGNGCWHDDYALGVLEFIGGDLCDAASWKKHPKPLLVKGNGVFGPGHASFFHSPDGKEFWCAYHGLAKSNPSNRPTKRWLNLQKVAFDESGFPVLGEAMGSVEQSPPSGERDR